MRSAAANGGRRPFQGPCLPCTVPCLAPQPSRTRLTLPWIFRASRRPPSSSRAHQAWAPVIVAVLAFCESLAFLSLLAPATVMLVGIGSLIGATGLDFWPVWLGAAVGASLGDWVSYEV